MFGPHQSEGTQGASLLGVRLSDASMMRLNKAREAVAGKLDDDENLALAGIMENMSVPWGAECRIATINANGMPDNDKKDAIALFLLSFAVNICVISETHLREGDLVKVEKHFLEYGYRVGASCCRKLGKGGKKRRVRGGVMVIP